MNIRKVKLKDNKVIIVAEEVDDGGEPTKKLEITSRDLPRAEFDEAMQALAAPALALIEAPEAWGERARVIGLSVNYEADGRRGCVVTLRRPCAGAHAPLVLNSPHMREWQAGDQGERWMSDEMLEAMKAALDEARRFLAGERAQGNLLSAAA